MHRRIDGYTLAVVDLLTALVVVFAAMAVLAIISIDQQRVTSVRAGSLAIELTWPHRYDADVDLWVRAPGDHPVGYSHMSDKHCNLVRDDLGRAMDPESENTEVTFCRGDDPGEWAVNAMLYRSYDDNVPLTATITVTRLGDGSTQLLQRTVTIKHEGQQVTAFRFRLNTHDHLVPGSVNHLPCELYSPGENECP